MRRSVFNKEIPEYCKNCAYGKSISFSSEIICKKNGIMNPLDSCRSYKYDPLKREPEVPVIKEEFNNEDFSI